MKTREKVDAESAPTVGEVSVKERPGSVVGRYKLLEKIGEGGMGVVYMAEQIEPVTRRVALKIIKLGMDTKQVVARFEAERQALAMMDHPNIARVLDGGATETGRPYFVLELVPGIPITEFCIKNKLSAKEIIELFIPVCFAIQHAHQKGIIHRDIKPTNVLVSLLNSEPTAKVIDFGVAKATNQKLTEKTLFTNFTTMIGTPAYMSPEQAEMSVLDIDTRTDVYSLGVLLYELLTGTTPFPEKRLRSVGYGEMQRIIAEEEPEKPSTRLSKLCVTRSAKIGRGIPTEPSGISRLAAPSNSAIDSDLDWITLKCLEKDRRRRYETSNGLAADLKRHLDDEPVSAAAPSVTYRFHKAWRRNKVIYTAGAAVFAALVIGISVSVWQATSASRAADREEQQRIAAENLKGIAEANETEARRLAEEIRLVAYVSDMKVIQNALDEHNLLTARRLLNRHRPKSGETDLRGLEWRYLWSRARGDEQDQFDPHNGIASFSGYSPDGRFIATAGFDHRMKIWNATTRRPMAELEIGDLGLDFNLANFAPFSPDGKRFAAIQGGELKVWDTATWRVVDNFGAAGYPVMFATKTNLLSARVGSAIKIWNVETRRSQEVPEVIVKSPKNWALSPDGRLLAEDQNGLTIWKLPEVEKIADGLGNASSRTFMFSPSGKLLAQITAGATLRLWGVEEWEIIAEIQPHSGRFDALAFSPDGNVVATSGVDTLVHLWSVPELEPLATYQGHLNEVWKVNFSPDGRTLVSAGKERTVRFWNVPERLAKVEETTGPDENRPSWGGGLDRPVSKDQDGFAQFWKIDQGRWLPDFRLETGKSNPAFSADGKWALTGAEGGYEIFDRRTGTRIKTITVNPGRVYQSNNALSPDGRLLIGWAGQGNGWRVLDIGTESDIAHLNGPHTIANMFRPAFSPDGRILAYPGPDWTFRLWDVAEQKEAAVLGGHTWIASRCVFSRDGRFLVTTSFDGTARIWEVPSGKLHAPPLVGHVVGVNRATFTPNARTLLTSGDDDTVRMWNVATGQEMVRISDRNYVMLSSDGNTLVVTDASGRGRRTTLIPIPTLEEIDKIETMTTEP